MKKNININIDGIDKLFINIKDLILESRKKVYKTVNIEMISLYW